VRATNHTNPIKFSNANGQQWLRVTRSILSQRGVWSATQGQLLDGADPDDALRIILEGLREEDQYLYRMVLDPKELWESLTARANQTSKAARDLAIQTLKSISLTSSSSVEEYINKKKAAKREVLASGEQVCQQYFTEDLISGT
jgi:hypothetical protein